MREAPGVKERRRDVGDLACAQRDPRQQRHHRIERLGVAPRRALGRAGRAAREDYASTLALGRRQVVRRAGGDELVERGVGQALRVVPGDDALAPPAGVGDQIAELSSYTMLGLLALTTRSCGPAKRVRCASAPASTRQRGLVKARGLRHSATPSPSPIPCQRRVRQRVGARGQLGVVIVPSSSMLASSRGARPA